MSDHLYFPSIHSVIQQIFIEGLHCDGHSHRHLEFWYLTRLEGFFSLMEPNLPQLPGGELALTLLT